MGICTAGAQLLFAAKALGVDFTKSLTLGRQFFYPDCRALAKMFRCHAINVDPAQFLRDSRGWGENFFSLLGAKSINSLDASPFEGADIIHDLNCAVEESLKNRFTVVYDGGTLEHIFNFPEAIRNCMEMLGLGGCFIQFAPTNNFTGHGFYQFSPELIYRVFTHSNGFETVTVLLNESVRGGRWYAVADPATVGKRVQMTNKVPTSVCTIARRVRILPPFQEAPQQSDYAMGWQQQGLPSGGLYTPGSGWRRKLAEAAKKMLPARLERFLRMVYVPGLETQPNCYRRIQEGCLIRGERLQA